MDIIGIGALNIDYIKSMPFFLSPSASSLRQEFEPGKEEWVSDNNIDQKIHNIGTAGFYIGPGGSAFNTIRCLAQLSLGMSVGYVGVAGKPRIDEPDLKATAIKDSIDLTWIFNSDHSNSPGTCISLYWPRERSCGLRTAPGANVELATKLSDADTQNEISAYIANSKWVNLTSFVNQECIFQVVQILKNAKTMNRNLKISFDPGSEYCRNPTETVKEANISDYLFLNWKEFCQLGNYEEAQQLLGGKIDEKEIASYLFEYFQGPK